MANFSSPIDVIKRYLEDEAPARGGWQLLIYVTRPERLRSDAMGMPVKSWAASREKEDDVWFVKVEPRLHRITGFEGRYDIFIGQQMLTFQRDNARLAKTLDKDQLLVWLRAFPIVTVVLKQTTLKRSFTSRFPQPKQTERILFDCRLGVDCYAHRMILRPIATALKGHWVPAARGRLAVRHWKERVVPELRTLPPMSEDPRRKHVLPREGGVNYRASEARFYGIYNNKHVKELYCFCRINNSRAECRKNTHV